MDDAIQKEESVAPKIDLNRGRNNPVHVIRSNMKKEIIIQLVCIVIFMTYPLVIAMPELSEAVYYIFMFITSMMTMGYIIKLTFFLKRTSDFSANTKDAIRNFIYEAKLTLEVYKSFVIAGSLLLPVPVFALLSGFKMSGDQYLFEKWFTLDISGMEMTFLIVGYLIAAVVFYYITVGWAKMLYGKYLRELEKVIADLNE